MGRRQKRIQAFSERLTEWVGTPTSVIVHTIFFAGMFFLVLFGWSLQDMLLVLTTLLSIEAIYLALFIQMSINKTTESLEDVEKDIDIIQRDEKKDDIYDIEVAKTLKTIQSRLQKLQKDLDHLKEKGAM